METKPLLYGVIGFLLGGLVVSTVAVTVEKDKFKGSSAPIPYSLNELI